jgi:hypothetical protein
MKNLAAAIIFVIPTVAFAADGPAALGPNQGKFGDWTAATYGAGANKICYAFTDAAHSDPVMKKRGTVMLTVTERPGVQDEVTLAAGYAYPASAAVQLSVGKANISFYTQGENAFTISGADAISAFKNGATAEAAGPGPHGHKVTDDFSLTGFSGAYAAITAACK